MNSKTHKPLKFWNGYYVINDMPEETMPFLHDDSKLHSITEEQGSSFFSPGLTVNFGFVKEKVGDGSVETWGVAFIHWHLVPRVTCKFIVFGDVHGELHDRIKATQGIGLEYACTLIKEYSSMELLEELFEKVFDMGKRTGRSERSSEFRDLLFRNDYGDGMTSLKKDLAQTIASDDEEESGSF